MATVEHGSIVHWTVEPCSTVNTHEKQQISNLVAEQRKYFFLLYQTLIYVAAGEAGARSHITKQPLRECVFPGLCF